MKSYGDQINQEAVVSKVLRSLGSKFNHIVAAIEEAHDLSSYSFDELMSLLLDHEGTPHKNKPRRKYSKLKVTPLQRVWLKVLISEEIIDVVIVAVVVAEVEAEEEVNLMKDKIGTPFNGEFTTSMATKMLIVGANQKCGCLNHMCGARTMFQELDESQRKEVTLGNDWKIKVKGKVILQLKPHNVIGHSILFDDSCVIKDKKLGKIVANMTLNRIFPFHITTVESFDLVAGASVKNIWHLRYGHLSINGLQFLEHKGILKFFEQIGEESSCQQNLSFFVENMESMSVIISITKKCFCCDSWAQPSFEDVLWNLQYDAEVQANAQGPTKTPLFMGF
ncbi:hypothetical protein Tco_0868646 [Tanacetum coccineum]